MPPNRLSYEWQIFFLKVNLTDCSGTFLFLDGSFTAAEQYRWRSGHKCVPVWVRRTGGCPLYWQFSFFSFWATTSADEVLIWILNNCIFKNGKCKVFMVTSLFSANSVGEKNDVQTTSGPNRHPLAFLLSKLYSRIRLHSNRKPSMPINSQHFRNGKAYGRSYSITFQFTGENI